MFPKDTILENNRRENRLGYWNRAGQIRAKAVLIKMPIFDLRVSTNISSRRRQILPGNKIDTSIVETEAANSR